MDQNRLEYVQFTEYAIKSKCSKESGESKVKRANFGKKNTGAISNADGSQTNSMKIEESRSARKPKTAAKKSRKKHAKKVKIEVQISGEKKANR